MTTTITIGLIEQARQSTIAIRSAMVQSKQDLEAAHQAAETAEKKVKSLAKALQVQNDTASSLKGEAYLKCMDEVERLGIELKAAQQQAANALECVGNVNQRVKAQREILQRDEPREREATIAAAKIAREIKQLEAESAGIEDVIGPLRSILTSVVDVKALIAETNPVFMSLQKAEQTLREAIGKANSQTGVLASKRAELVRYGA